jgi:hypothetical protein
MLKKCIAFAVIFAAVAGAAFAQITFGGQLQEGMTLFSGNNVKDNDVNMGGTYNSTYHEAKFSVLFGDGTAGGRLVWTLNGKSMWGWMQWRPNQFFRVKIGSDGDGEGGFPQIIGWGFTGEAKNSVAAVNDYDGTLPMKYRHAGLNYGGFDGADDFHLMFCVFPIDMLQVNILFRNFDKATEISERFANAQLFASYKLEEIGTIRFAWEGKGGLAKKDEEVKNEEIEKKIPGNAIGKLHLAFYSNELVQGLAFELGAQYNLPYINISELYDPIAVGGGINLTSTDPFNLKVRAGIEFGGTKQNDKKEVEANTETKFSVGILPSYKLPKMTVFFHAGVGVINSPDKIVTDDEGNETTGEVTYSWFVNPYIWVPMGGMRMWVGLQIIDEHVMQDGQFKWNIPFGFNFYF